MKIEVAYYTGIGNTRENNEDSILIYDKVYSESNFGNFKIKKINTKEGFVSVADGLGGHAGGEIASGTVLEFLKYKKIQEKRDLKKLFEQANINLNDIANERPELRGMGTVLTGIYIKENRAIVFNIGDSRTYFMREKFIRMTDDHSLVWDLMKKESFQNEGEMHDWVRKHPRKNIITSALIAGADEFYYYIKEIEIKKGDKFFIASDGVWEELSYDEMEDAVSKDLSKGAESLLEKCRKRGKDNVSFIMVEIIDI
ncbi:protein phosphatase 2C domain-containing protein [uncultured Ilyobacter sp.]|uniref:PP2C family protein-serine/threonine phosphatase n=1 Tax=uncultured Ilyobacter sp. TaxID=544433 RepID=UPI0029C6DF08|nr:protein phosphatase 2C domain-containing protein [uncultured Ilyobacter sp.]